MVKKNVESKPARLKLSNIPLGGLRTPNNSARSRNRGFCESDNEPTEIVEKLFVSNYQGVSKLKALQRQGIDVIVNLCSHKCENKFPNHFEYENFTIPDKTDHRINRELRKAAKMIDSHLKLDRRVVIHCRKGISRAPTVVLAYLILYRKYHFKEALRYVKEKHNRCNPNFGFLVQLLKIDK